MSICLTLRPDAKAVFKQLDSLAETAGYDANHLHQFRNNKAVYRCRETVYYLASLYLHIGERAVANELLSELDTASNAMKRFFQVMAYSHRFDLPVPVLNSVEKSCIGFLEEALNPVSNTLESVVVKSGGFSVVGNAPGASFQKPHVGVRFYFNNYKSNNRINKDASIHVVTPSWDRGLTKSADAICITGNDIFHRRSRVWEKFKGDNSCTAIYTVPTQLWGSLYKELGASPSAGLLVLCWLTKIAQCNEGMLNGYVAGFSNGHPQTNHSYDAEPASTRHNWEVEAVIRERLLYSLEKSCLNFVVES